MNVGRKAVHRAKLLGEPWAVEIQASVPLAFYPIPMLEAPVYQ